MKKIAIDMTHYGKTSGYGVVATNIINRLLTSNKFEFYLLSTEKKELPSDLRNKKNVHQIIFDVKFYFLYRLWTQASLLKKYKIDIFYTPDQIVPLRKVCRYISTIHDLYCRKKFRGMKAFKLYNKRTVLYHLVSLDRIFAEKSDYIITPSTDSKNDILKEFGIRNEKIIMGHWGMDHMKVSVMDFHKEDYILFPLCADCDNHFIFRLGKKIIEDGYTKKIIFWKPQNDIGKLPVFEDKRTELLMKRISDDEKCKLISEAKLSIYVSEMEGFGFVPLECQACGCPIIYHRVGSLEEIVGKSGVGMDGFEINDYISAVDALVNNIEMYYDLQNKGINNVKKYKWNDVCVKIENVFCS